MKFKITDADIATNNSQIQINVRFIKTYSI